MKPEDQLKERPRADEIGADYKAMLTAMRDRLATLVPGAEWSTSIPEVESAAPCKAPFDTIEGAIAETWRGATGIGSIPAATWPSVLEELTGIAHEHGFTEVTVIKDTPQEHAAAFHDKYGAEIELASAKNTTLTLFGGCFIDATPATVPIVPPSS